MLEKFVKQTISILFAAALSLLGAMYAYGEIRDEMAISQDTDGLAVYYYSGNRRIDMMLALDELAVDAPDMDHAASEQAVRNTIFGTINLSRDTRRAMRSTLRLGSHLRSRDELTAVAVELKAKGITALPALYPQGRSQRSNAVRKLVSTQLAIAVHEPLRIREIAQDYGLHIEKEMGDCPGVWILSADDALSALDAARIIHEQEKVIFAEPVLLGKHSLRFVPDDPLFSEQWHLQNTGQSGGTAGADINVVSAWDTVKGAGINIGIVDEGMEVNHPDLAANARTDIDWDFMDDDDDPSPESSDEAHGTMVGGSAAAVGNNELGVSGVAPEAKLVSHRIGESPLEVANAFLHHYDDAVVADLISIKNNSWGPYDDGETMEAPSSIEMTAIRNAVNLGRGGLGTVFVWAGGNGGENSDDVGFDGYASSRYVIAVGALNRYGTRATYSESGSALVLIAPGGSNSADFLTTDLPGALGYDSGDYVHTAGTSFASPVVAGVVALMLQANPNLTWRDVQHVLASTATHLDPANTGWHQNAGGFWFNHEYGFGLVNASAAVAAASEWVNKPAEASPLDSGSLSVGLTVPDNSPTGISETFEIPANSNFVIETVEVVFNMSHENRGQIEVELVSPGGTTAKLANLRPDQDSNFSNWMFTSNAQWGENPSGSWTLTVKDRVSGTTGQWNSWQLICYGYESTEPLLPAGPTNLDLSTLNDTGISSQDKVTRQTNGLKITGLAPASSTVRLYESASLIATGTSEAFLSLGLDVNLAEGTHQIRASWVDANSIESRLSQPLEIIVDTTPPSPLFDGPIPDQFFTAEVEVGLTAEEFFPLETSDLTTVNADILGMTAHGNSYRIRIRAKSEGEVRLSLAANKVTDIAGNPNQTTVEIVSTYLFIPGPTDLTATIGAYTDRVYLTWSPLATMPHYQVYRSETLNGTRLVVSGWITSSAWWDRDIVPGTTYYYWVRAAQNADGSQGSDYSNAVTGSAGEIIRRPKTYRVTFKKCFLDDRLDTDGTLAFTNTDHNSSVKIRESRSFEEPGLARQGVYYIFAAEIPTVDIDYEIGKFYSEAPIGELRGGSIKSLTTKNEWIEWISVFELGSLKMTATKDFLASPAIFPSTNISTESTQYMNAYRMKIALNGVCLASLETFQDVKSIKTATKAGRDPQTHEKTVSLAGIGHPYEVALDALGESRANAPRATNYFYAFDIGSISTKGAPIVLSVLDANPQKISAKTGTYSMSQSRIAMEGNIRINQLNAYSDIKSISAKAKKLSGQPIGGHIGYPVQPERMNVYIDNAIIGTIRSDGGVSGIFQADEIRKIQSKEIIEGEAHVLYDSINIKGDDTFFEIFLTQ